MLLGAALWIKEMNCWFEIELRPNLEILQAFNQITIVIKVYSLPIYIYLCFTAKKEQNIVVVQN